MNSFDKTMVAELKTIELSYISEYIGIERILIDPVRWYKLEPLKARKVQLDKVIGGIADAIIALEGDEKSPGPEGVHEAVDGV